MNTPIDFDRAMMNGMTHELKAHGLKAYKDAYVMKNSFGWFFHAPSLNFSRDFSKNKCFNAYQARYEGWLSYLNERGLLKFFNPTECNYNADK